MFNHALRRGPDIYHLTLYHDSFGIEKGISVPIATKSLTAHYNTTVLVCPEVMLNLAMADVVIIFVNRLLIIHCAKR
jgi:hypothetical protein